MKTHKVFRPFSPQTQLVWKPWIAPKGWRWWIGMFRYIFSSVHRRHLRFREVAVHVGVDAVPLHSGLVEKTGL